MLKMTPHVGLYEVIEMSDHDEMKMTGLILSQSALVGVAIGVYSSGLWLPAGGSGQSWMSGMTYAMGALAVQTIAYYLFKMFFEQGMKEKVEIAEMQRQRQSQSRQLQLGFDQRRADLELRVQEMQLENEIRMLHENPERITPGFSDGAMTMGVGDYHTAAFNPGIKPTHDARADAPMNLGLSPTQAAVDALTGQQVIPAHIPPPPPPPGMDIPLKKDGTPDLRYKSPPQ